MARLLAGGTPDAVATATTQETQVGGSGARVKYQLTRPRLAHTVWVARLGGQQLTDLLLDVDGSPISAVVADDAGQLPAFRLPDGLIVDGVWLDPDDASTDRFWLPIRIGPAAVRALAPDPATKPDGYVLTVTGGVPSYQALPGTGTSAVSIGDI